MISLAPVWALVIRHLTLYKRDLNLIIAALFWPLLDILMWGFIGKWMASSSATGTHSHLYTMTLLLGVLLWQVVGRGTGIMNMAFIEELWAHNVVNLFSLPLKLSEWMCGVLVYYFFGISLSTAVCMLASFTLYDLPVWHFISTYLLFMPPLFLCGVGLGFLCLQIIFTLGKRGVELGWMVSWILMPFSGAYYPIEVLPAWGQTISAFLPMSYVMQGMREYVMYERNPTMYLLKGYALGAVYAVCGVLLFVYCFNRSKQRGLARLVD
jgi:ABC-2 type transport system permease protein